MKSSFSTALAVACASLFATGLVAANPSLDTDRARASYMVGMDIGASLKQLEGEVDVDVLVQGLRDVFTDQEPRLSQEEFEEVRNTFSAQLQSRQADRQREQADRNRGEGQAYLATNGARAGVTTTASGLQYEVMQAGTGPNAQLSDQVKVHYRGTLIDGTEFDSSYSRNQPAVFALSGVIAGWTEALQLMNVGSKYRLVIPSELAYGERGTPGPIGPHATLIFEVELMEILN